MSLAHFFHFTTRNIVENSRRKGNARVTEIAEVALNLSGVRKQTEPVNKRTSDTQSYW